MKIVVNNIDELLETELSQMCEIVELKDKPDGAFIQWTTGFDEYLFLCQTKIIGQCIDEGIPLIIFDKFQKMSVEEVSFLVKPGIFLWEPTLNDRMFFSFQPNWGKIPKMMSEVSFPNTKRTLSFGYVRKLRQKLSTFEQYFKPISDVGEYQAGFVDRHANPAINQRVMEMGVDIYNGVCLDQIKSTRPRLSPEIGSSRGP